MAKMLIACRVDGKVWKELMERCSKETDLSQSEIVRLILELVNDRFWEWGVDGELKELTNERTT